MAMPDAIRALVELAGADEDRLSQRVYNITAFSLSAGELRERVLAAFPQAEITFARDGKRAAIIDTWPADVDDSLANRDWGWRPEYNVDRTFDEYLIPTITRKYT
jgi:threonine 3-dehydrogenase